MLSSLAVELFCHHHTLEEINICSNDIKMPWPLIDFLENQLFSSPWRQIQIGQKLLKSYFLTRRQTTALILCLGFFIWRYNFCWITWKKPKCLADMLDQSTLLNIKKRACRIFICYFFCTQTTELDFEMLRAVIKLSRPSFRLWKMTLMVDFLILFLPQWFMVLAVDLTLKHRVWWKEIMVKSNVQNNFQSSVGLLQ